ncbi:hypothetical protein TRVA0_031S00474 [Trichomonascus vanleenenianus]|uniref:pyridoxal phosphate-dependent decarboxylase family protein n=1 Tax=Trichomonascus vanleenenianus TaxID=2268995 RepID=UPI003ECB2A59
MTMDSLTSSLESNRAAELEFVLENLTKKLVEYAKRADSPDGNVGNHYTPQELKKSLKLDLPESGSGPEGLLREADQLLDNSVVTWNEGFLDKLYAATNPVGVASDLLLSILNTNSHVFTVSPALTLIENKTGHEYAKLFGFKEPHSGGLTFPGGSYSNSTSLTIARSYLYPDTKTKGNGAYKFAIFASAHAHYSVEKAAIFCGLGSESVFKVKVSPDGRMIVDDLRQKVEQAKADGYTPLYVNATAGTTVYGSFDDFHAIGDVAREHKMWFHVDGSWGGNVVFSEKQRYKLSGVERADSLTVNPHKMLGVPTTCSFLLLPDKRVMQIANSLQAPYLFHNHRDDDDELYDLADATMGCGRRPDAVKLYLGWHWFGREGYGQRVDHAFDVTKYLATRVRDHPNFELVSEFPPPCLQTCFFYKPRGQLLAQPEENSKLTRGIVYELHKSKKFLIDFAPDALGRGEFFRVVVNSPVVSRETIDVLISEMDRVGRLLSK